MLRFLVALFLLLVPAVVFADDPPPAISEIRANPDAAISALGISPFLNVLRPPGQTDNLPVGSTWLDAAGNVYQSIDATAGFTMWQQVQSDVLPVDVAPLNVTAAIYSSGGGSCVPGEVLTFTGGARVTVSTCAGGVPSTYSITQSRLRACPSSLNPSLTPISSTGGDTASVWSVALQSPWVYATALMTRCYTANKALNVGRSYETSATAEESTDIGFAPDGSLDVKVLDSFAAGGAPMAQYSTHVSGVNPRVNVWYDQGYNAAHATQSTLAYRPTVFPGRLAGNARTIMLDGRSSSWDPPLTYLNLPSGLSINLQSNTFATLAGVVSPTVGDNLIHIGAQSSTPLLYSANVNGAHQFFQNGTSNKILNGVAPDEPTLYLAASNSTGTVYWNGNVPVSYAAGDNITVSGGTLGEAWNSSSSTPQDAAFVVIWPYALTAAEQSAFQAAVARRFRLPIQKRGVLLVLGDSHNEAYGYPYGQSMPRQAMALLNRLDISLVNMAMAGFQLSSFLGGAWTGSVSSALAPYSANKYVLIQGGYNDIISGGQTVAQVEATYTTLSGNAHGNGAKVICDTDVIRNASSTVNGQIQAIAAWMAATPTVCDYVFNEFAYSVFNQATGPWSLPWFEQQDSGVHTTAAGAGLRAAMLAQFIQANGLFK